MVKTFMMMGLLNNPFISYRTPPGKQKNILKLILDERLESPISKMNVELDV